MFALSEGGLAGRVLGCGDGPASFNAGLTGREGCFSRSSLRVRGGWNSQADR